MSIINNNVYTKLPVYEKNIIKKNEQEKDNLNNSSTPDERNAEPETPGATLSGSQLDNDFLITYRGVEINHINTALEKNIVSKIAPKPLIQTPPKKEVKSPYLIESSLFEKTSIKSLYKSSKPFLVVFPSLEKGLSESEKIMNSMLNDVANRIFFTKRKELRGDFDSSLIKKMMDEAVSKTVDEFLNNPYISDNALYKASENDKGLVFAKSSGTQKVRLSFNVRNFADKFLENYTNICQTNANPAPEPTQEEIIESKINDTMNRYTERYSKAFADETEFASVFASAKASAMEQIAKDNISENKDILFVFDRALSTSINDYLWSQYEKESAQAETVSKIPSQYYRSRAAVSATKNKVNTPSVTTNKTFPSKDGGTITINYQGVFVNGMLVTDSKAGTVNCNITFTDKNGNKTTIPFNIGLDLLPEQNKKAMDAWKNSEYYYTGDPDYIINSNSGFHEGDFYTQEKWFDKLIGQMTNMLSGLSEEAINVLKAKQPDISIENKQFRPDGAANALGVYNLETHTISLYTEILSKIDCKFDDKAFNTYTLTHEIGHSQDCSDKQWQSSKLFSNLEEWNKLKELMPETLQGAYAFDNVREFFAEYFAYQNNLLPKDSPASLKSVRAFQYLENELQKNPNSELSKIFGRVKNNAESIRQNKPIINNGEGVTNDKKYTNDELIDKIKDDWTYGKLTTKDFGGDWADIAETLGLKMQTKDIIAEYYKHHFLNQPSEIIKKLDNATGNTKYGDSIKKLWENMQTSTPYLDGLKDACENFDKKIKDAENSSPMVSDSDKETEIKPPQKEGFENDIDTGLNINNIKNNHNIPNIEGNNNINLPSGLDEKVQDALNNLGNYYTEQAKQEALSKYGKNANVEINVDVTVDGTGNVKVNVKAKVLGYINGNNGGNLPNGDITGGSGAGNIDRDNIPGLDKDGKIPVKNNTNNGIQGGSSSNNIIPGTNIDLMDPKYQKADGTFNMGRLVQDLVIANQAYTTTDQSVIKDLLRQVQNRYGNTISQTWDKYWSELGFGYTSSVNIPSNEELWGSSTGGFQDKDYYNSITAGYAAAQQAAQQAANTPKPPPSTAGYTNGYSNGSTGGYSNGYNNGSDGTYNYTHNSTAGYTNGYTNGY